MDAETRQRMIEHKRKREQDRANGLETDGERYAREFEQNIYRPMVAAIQAEIDKGN